MATTYARCSNYVRESMRPRPASAADGPHMHRLSMHFVEPSVEAAFLRSKQDQLCCNHGRAGALLAVGVLVMMMERVGAWPLMSYEMRIQTLAFVVIGVLGALSYLITASHWYKTRVSYHTAEALCVFCICAVGIANIFFDYQTVRRFAGEPILTEADDEWQPDHRQDCSVNHTSIAMVLFIDIALTTSHLLLPIRWSVMMWVDIFMLLALSGVHAVLAGHVTYRFSVYVCFLFFSCPLGLRLLEHKDRILFCTIADERRLRAQAEFSAEKDKNPRGTGRGPHGLVDECARSVSTSMPGSSPTEHVFLQAQASFRLEETSPVEVPTLATDSLEELRRLGMVEHWLIEEEELQVFEDLKLGSGACGVVSAGEFCRSPVAVKRPKISQAADVSTVWNELRVLRHVRHPNIAIFHGAYIATTSLEPTLVLERVYGYTFDRWVNHLKAVSRASPKAPEQIKLLLGVCQALIYLHTRKPCIVHADLKPGNIVVERRESGPFPKLLDFGLSCVVSHSSRLHGGTPAYVAPEVVQDSQYKPKRAADIFSLGRLTFFAASGRRPLVALRAAEIIAKLRQGHATPLAWTPRTALLDASKALIERCNDLTPANRPSAQKVHELLSTLLEPAEPEQGPCNQGEQGGQEQQQMARSGGGLIMQI